MRGLLKLLLATSLFFTIGKYEVVASSDVNKGWIANYYSNTEFQGIPYTTNHAELNFNWGHGSPHESIPINHFSAEFEKQMEFKGGFYQLVGSVDDLVKVYIGDRLVYEISKAGNHSFNELVEIPAGNHNVRVQFVELTGAARLSLDFQKVTEWQAKYYANNNFQGTPLIQTHKELNFNWGHGSPHESIPINNFSAEYEKEMEFEAGSYHLIGAVDDMVKVYIGNNLVYEINRAGHHTINEVIEVPAAGKHKVRVEFVELSGAARLSLDFIKSDGWLAKYYANNNFKGAPLVQSHKDLNFNWGHGSPHESIPINNFSAEFEKEMEFAGGSYHLVGAVDDLVKVYIGNNLVYEINRAGNHIINTVIQVPAGKHKVRVQYVEYTGAARLSLNFLKSEGWLGKYYANTQFQGLPVFRSHSEINFNWGGGSPDSSIPVDNFSAEFEREMEFEGGVYHLTGAADDLIKVFIGNNLIFEINRAGNHTIDTFVQIPAGKHKVKVQYVEFTGGARVSLDFAKPQDWLAKYYKNTTFSGKPVIKTHSSLNFNWGSGSPDSSIPVDNFSAEFEKEMEFEGGTYQLVGAVDDLIKVFINDKLVYEINRAGNHIINSSLQIPAGKHKVRVQFVEFTGGARLKLDFNRHGIFRIYNETQYSLTLAEVLTIQMGVAPQINARTYKTWIRSDGLINISNGAGTVAGPNWRLREDAGTNFWHVATVSNPTRLTIIGEKMGSDGFRWYEVNFAGWQNAKSDPTLLYLDPNNYSNKNSQEYLQYLKLSGTAGLSENEVNNNVLNGRGILANRGAAFIQAGHQFNINEGYLIAHALLETGNGTSHLASGVGLIIDIGANNKFTPRLAQTHEIADVVVYNMYGVGALDNCPVLCGATYAYEQGWDNPNKAIIGGARFIAQGYIDRGQDTLYKMRWNPGGPGTRQYATDIGWAVKQTSTLQRMLNDVYSSLNSYTLVYDFPVYKK